MHPCIHRRAVVPLPQFACSTVARARIHACTKTNERPARDTAARDERERERGVDEDARGMTTVRTMVRVAASMATTTVRHERDDDETDDGDGGGDA